MSRFRVPTSQLAIRLARRPVGLPKAGVDLVKDPRAHVTLPEKLKQGQFLVRNLYLSLDPAMRGWMSDAKSYIPPVPINDVMRGGCVGVVVSSKNERVRQGDIVQGMFGWQQFATAEAGFFKVPEEINPTLALGVLGMTGYTAYFGVKDVLQPEQGNTVLVSAAAGAVGSLVSQICKNIYGCRVVGIAGGEEKCNWLLENNLVDEVVDYKSPKASLWEDIKAATPKGIDRYFDNVGGETLDIALRRINKFGRIAVCGAISQYNLGEPGVELYGPKNYYQLLIKSATMQGFVVFDFAARYKEAQTDLVKWLSAGQLQHKEHIVDGLGQAAESLNLLFKGGNKGKLLVRIDDSESETQEVVDSVRKASQIETFDPVKSKL